MPVWTAPKLPRRCAASIRRAASPSRARRIFAHLRSSALSGRRAQIRRFRRAGIFPGLPGKNH